MSLPIVFFEVCSLILILLLARLRINFDHHGQCIVQQFVMHSHASMDGAGWLLLRQTVSVIRVSEAKLAQLLPLYNCQPSFGWQFIEYTAWFQHAATEVCQNIRAVPNHVLLCLLQGLHGAFPFPSVPEFIDPVLGVKMIVFAKTCPKRSFSI
jgi:hypothetical protein